jgi:hypothetical protein
MALETNLSHLLKTPIKKRVFLTRFTTADSNVVSFIAQAEIKSNI